MKKSDIRGIVLIVLVLINFIYMSFRIRGDSAYPLVVLLVLMTFLFWLLMNESAINSIIVIGIILCIISVYYIEIGIVNQQPYLQLPSLVRLAIVVALVLVQPFLMIGGINYVWNRVPHYQKLLPPRNSTKEVSSIWILLGLTIVIISYFVLASYDRSGIPGWDTPNYVWRSRLIGINNGLLLHINNYGNGLQLTFSTLASLLQTFLSVTSWNAVLILSACLAGVGSLAGGMLLYVNKSPSISSIMVILLTAGYFPTARFVADLRDNLSAWCFGTWAFFFFILSENGSKKHRPLYTIFSIICLVLTGYSHIAISSIFFMSIMIENVLRYFGGHSIKEIFKSYKNLWKFLTHIKIPLLSALVVGIILLPILKTYLLSIQKFGLETEALGGSTIDISWLMNNMNVYTFISWAILGLFTLLLNHQSNNSIFHRSILTWFFVCISLFLFLPGRLQYRFFFMLPIPILVGIGIDQVFQAKLEFSRYIQWAIKISVVVLIVGIIIPFNLSNSYKAINDRSVWVNGSTIHDMNSINTYIKKNDLQPPYTFLIYKKNDSMAFSVLWNNIIKAEIDSSYILDTYVYFGDLSFYLSGKREIFNDANQDIASDYWWEVMRANDVKSPSMVAFILEDFNPGKYEEYLFNPNVDIVTDGVLVVNTR